MAEIEGPMRGGGTPQPSDDQALARLLRLAGPRPQVEEERAARVRAVVHQHWRASLTEQAESSRAAGWVWWAAAAAVILATGAGLLLQQAAPGRSEQLATVETLVGEVLVFPAAATGTQGRQLHQGETLAADSVLETSAGARTALRLAAGQSLRLDTGTRLRLAAPGKIIVERGAVYLDSAVHGATVELQTPLGVVSNMGTQFELRLSTEELRIRVREGIVRLVRDGRSHEAGAGTELSMSADGTLVRRTVPQFGPQWSWVLGIAPAYELEGASLESFLRWVARETGWTVRPVDDATAAALPAITLHGSIAGLTPDQGPAAVLPTCDLDYTLKDGVLIIKGHS